MPTVAEVAALLQRFEPGVDPDAARSCQRVRDLLAHTAAPFSRRQYQPGHLTASGVVISPDGRRVLLVYHRRVARWLQPGGHVEPGDATLTAAAEREVLEETGVPVDPNLGTTVVGVDVHPIPPARGEPAHHHHDVAFAFLALTTDLPGTPERNRVVWCPVDQLERYDVDGALRRSVERARTWRERAADARRSAGGATG